MFFIIVILDCFTCIQKFEVTTQLANDLIWIIFKMDMNSHLNKVYTIDTQYRYCRCTVATTATLQVSHLVGVFCSGKI
jgi:hypothetical protein